MPLVTMRQILDHAAENGYGVPAFNINDMEQVIAVLQAAKKVNAPVILQTSTGARKLAGDPMIRHMVAAGIEMFPELPICIHQDHGASVESVAVTSCLTPYPLFMDFPEAVGTISSGIRDITPLMEAE